MEIESFEIDSDSDLNTSPIDESFFCYTELSDLLKSRSKMNDPIYWHKKVKRICRGVEKPTDGLENQFYQKPIALIDTRRHEQLRQIKDRVALLKASDNQHGPKIDVCYNDNPFISNPNFLSEPNDDAIVSRLPFDLANNLADGIIVQSSDWLSPFENEIENEKGNVNEKLKKKVVNLLINPPPNNIQVNGLKPGDVLPTPYDIVNYGIRGNQGNQKVRYPSYSFIPYGLEQRLPQGTDYKQLFDTSYISKTKVKKSAKKSASKVKTNIVQKIYKLQAKIPIAKNKIVKRENIKKNIKNLFQNIPVFTNVEDIPQKGDCILFIYTGTLYGYEKKKIDDVPKANYLRYKIFHLRNGNIHDDVTQLYDDFHTLEPKAMKNEINVEFFGCYPSKGEDEKIRRMKNINSTIVPFSFSSEDLDPILEFAEVLVHGEGDEIVNEGENNGESDENEEKTHRNLFDIFKLHASKLNIRLTQLQLQTIQPLIEKEKEKKKGTKQSRDKEQGNEKQTIVKLAIMFYYLVIFGRSESKVRQYFQHVHSFHWKKIEEKLQAIKTLQFQNVPYEKKMYDAILAKEKEEKEKEEKSSKSNDSIDLTKLYTMNWRFDNEQKTNKTANKNKTTTRREKEREKASLLLPLNLPKRSGNQDERKIKTMNYDEVQTGVRTIGEKEKKENEEKEDTQQNKSKHKKELEVAFKRDAESNKLVSDFLLQKDNEKVFLSKDESVSIMALNSFVLYLVPLVLGKIAYQWLSNNPKISYVKKYIQFNIEHANINMNSLLLPLSSVNSVRSLVHDQMMNPKQKGLDHLRFVYLILQSTKNVNQSILKLLKSYLTDLQDQLISKLDDSIDELQMFREQDKIKRMQFLGTMNSEDARAFAQAFKNGIAHYPQFYQDEFERKKEDKHGMDVGDGHGGDDE